MSSLDVKKKISSFNKCDDGFTLQRQCYPGNHLVGGASFEVCKTWSKPDNLLSLDFSVHNLLVVLCFLQLFLASLRMLALAWTYSEARNPLTACTCSRKWVTEVECRTKPAPLHFYKPCFYFKVSCLLTVTDAVSYLLYVPIISKILKLKAT